LTAKNDITGDAIRSKNSSKEYASNWDRIFGKKDKETKPEEKKDSK